jgi:hypothetical protein
MVITNTAKICPDKASGDRNLEKATKLMFTALNINSMDIKTPTAFRRVNSPNIPTQNRAAARIR